MEMMTAFRIWMWRPFCIWKWRQEEHDSFKKKLEALKGFPRKTEAKKKYNMEDTWRKKWRVLKLNVGELDKSWNLRRKTLKITYSTDGRKINRNIYNTGTLFTNIHYIMTLWFSISHMIRTMSFPYKLHSEIYKYWTIQVVAQY